jgi:hypothetical protein
MSPSDFPSFVKKLPEADWSYTGVKGWVLFSEKGQYVFNEAFADTTIPFHSHATQSGVVIAGKIEIIIGTKNQTYSQGDTYFIPGGTVHKMHLFPGYKGMDYYTDRNCYRIKPTR